MHHYQQRPVLIEAWEITPQLFDDYFEGRLDTLKGVRFHLLASEPTHITVNSTEGELAGHLGDWLVRSARGHLFTCSADTFALVYEPVSTQEVTQEVKYNEYQTVLHERTTARPVVNPFPDAPRATFQDLVAAARAPTPAQLGWPEEPPVLMFKTPDVLRTVRAHEVGSSMEALVIKVLDAPGHGGASHSYRIEGFNTVTNPSNPKALAFPGGGFSGATFMFQNGPLDEVGVNGITHESLLAILIDRLEHFQQGMYANRHNEDALTHCRAALVCLQHRTRERQARGVEGTHRL